MNDAPLNRPLPSDLATVLNQGCYCHTLDREALQQHLSSLFEGNPEARALMDALPASHPHLFSPTVVFITQDMRGQLELAVACLERVMGSAQWRARALQGAPAVSQADHGPAGALMGYDFHISEAGPKLIEINTNAGGALLNAKLQEAQTQCCRAVPGLESLQPFAVGDVEQQLGEMFQAEWATQRGEQPPHSVAIVDDDPEQQYLAPEFTLFAQLLRRRGLHVVVVDPKALRWDGSALTHNGVPIDLVYNRLTDFSLSEPTHFALHEAYVAGGVVVTPNPHVHALRADKSLLTLLSDGGEMQALGIAAADRELLMHLVPRTLIVTPENAPALWASRAQWFFKPMDGFGARAVYRGDKITRKVWEHVVQGPYVAQAVVTPPVRALSMGGERTALKYDLRAYTYRGEILLLAARTYQGQTTNFRTEGGGFAPVAVIPEGLDDVIRAAFSR